MIDFNFAAFAKSNFISFEFTEEIYHEDERYFRTSFTLTLGLQSKLTSACLLLNVSQNCSKVEWKVVLIDLQRWSSNLEPILENCKS